MCRPHRSSATPPIKSRMTVLPTSGGTLPGGLENKEWRGDTAMRTPVQPTVSQVSRPARLPQPGCAGVRPGDRFDNAITVFLPGAFVHRATGEWPPGAGVIDSRAEVVDRPRV